MTLALGDALAVTLMDKRDFSQEDYKIFHPGGKLGARLARVEELMHTGDELPLVEASATPMSDVSDNDEPKGFWRGHSDWHQNGDLWQASSPTVICVGKWTDYWAQTAAEVMTPDPLTITPKVPRVRRTCGNEHLHKRTCLLVCDEGTTKPLGILHIHDCLRAGVD